MTHVLWQVRELKVTGTVFSPVTKSRDGVAQSGAHKGSRMAFYHFSVKKSWENICQPFYEASKEK
jgi:hypothetical protein